MSNLTLAAVQSLLQLLSAKKDKIIVHASYLLLQLVKQQDPRSLELVFTSHGYQVLLDFIASPTSDKRIKDIKAEFIRCFFVLEQHNGQSNKRKGDFQAIGNVKSPKNTV